MCEDVPMYSYTLLHLSIYRRNIHRAFEHNNETLIAEEVTQMMPPHDVITVVYGRN